MQNNTGKPIQSLLQDPSSFLSFIQKKVIELNQLNQIWTTEFPSFAPFSRVANFRDNALIIELDNAAWATRLRYVIPEIMDKLVQHALLSTLKCIEWYIQPVQTIQTSQADSLCLSENNKLLLKNTALAIKTESLQQSLLKLIL